MTLHKCTFCETVHSSDKLCGFGVALAPSHASRLRAEIVEWAKKWREGDDETDAMTFEGMALVDALAIAEKDEYK